MGILEQYKKALEREETDMNLPKDVTIDDNNIERYKAELEKLRKGLFSESEISESIENSKKNMKDFGEEHTGGANEISMSIKPIKVSDDEMNEKNLLVTEDITDIKVIRAYCPKCGRELVSQAPPMYNPFTMEKMCLHECCNTKFNLDKPYPHIAFFDKNGNEIKSYGL